MTVTSCSRIVVAMSGGVDSAVVAALLKERGHQVVGVTLKFNAKGTYTCCATRDVVDASRIAKHIGIPHHVLDYESLFRKSVIMPFIDAYYKGKTPIPCVLCNKAIKFQYLLDFTSSIGADYLATGHYVRKIDGPEGPELWRSRNKKRDQSYFLFTITRAQLQLLYFPLGEIGNKTETRTHARRLNLLAVLRKKDSQDVCFAPDRNYRHVLSQYRANQPGKIVHINGHIIGQHKSIAYYTIGQRKGLNVSHSNEPVYVLNLEPVEKLVIVGPYVNLLRERLRVTEINWISPEYYLRLDRAEVSVQLRSMHKPLPAIIYCYTGNTADILLTKPVTGIVPGQACVFYHMDLVLGGGWII